MDRPQPNESSIFDIARHIDSGDAREQYLKQACGDDDALRKRVDALLSAEKSDDGFFESPPPGIDVTRDDQRWEQEGETVGPYLLLQKIGEGGFGVVYMAEQTEPIRRKIALKIIKPGMDSQEVIARFEAERQALAMMNHPNIASVLDGGCTPTGRPYFVMELVRGVSLTEYCDKKHLRPVDRLNLFMDVCHAVQHAHQKGIIHRDLKPSNIMVTLHDGNPVVKVIDFGVAKAINQQLTDKHFFTRYGQMIGTPQYMSPEQAEMSGLGVDTLSDVYSLGVVLYELLVGKTPLDGESLRQAGLREMQRIICEDEPARPANLLSTTAGQELSDIAEHRGLSPESLANEIRGDLEWIVMKTLEKERDRRYTSPLDLCRDLQRFLRDEPVEARPPSMAYRVTKYIRRNRGLVASIAMFTMLLFSATCISLSLWSIASREKKLADLRLVELEQEKHISEEATARAEAFARQRDQQATQLEGMLYPTLIRRASLLVEGSEFEVAKQVLDQCPESHRDWEWKRLMFLVSQSGTLLRGNQAPHFPGRSDRLVAIGEDSRSVCVWDLPSHQFKVTIPVFSSAILGAIAMHPDNKVFAVADHDGNIFLVDIEQQRVILELREAHSNRIDGLGFSADGKRIASAGWVES